MVLTSTNDIIRPNFNKIPKEMKEAKQWVVWRVKNTNKNLSKIPVCVNGSPEGWQRSDRWGTFEEAVQAYDTGEYDGIGFVLANGFVGIDIDDALHNSQLSDTARTILQQVDSYSEVSVSGTGVHVICKGELPSDINKKNTAAGVEVYNKARFFTITGRAKAVKPIQEQTEGLRQVAEMYLMSTKKVPVATTETNRDESLSDSEVQEIMSRDDKIRQLLDGDLSDYPSSSEADMALCNHLAFYTAKNSAQMDRLFRASGLYRDKWDERRGQETYGDLTIKSAIANTQNEYSRNYSSSPIVAQNEEKDETEKKKKSKAEMIIEAAEKQNIQFSKDANGALFARYQVGDHLEVHPVNSTVFKYFLGQTYMTEFKAKSIGRSPLDEALMTYEIQAHFQVDQQNHDVFQRVGEHEGIMYIDPIRPDWSVLEVNEQGYRHVPSSQSPVWFTRSDTMLQLPEPEAPANVKALKNFVKLNDNDFLLLVAFLVISIRRFPRLGNEDIGGAGSYPMLLLSGTPGSGKTSAVKAIRGITDPNSSSVMSVPESADDLSSSASDQFMFAYDNVSDFNRSKSDLFSSVATGRAISKRKAYTVNDNFSIFIKRPQILTGINSEMIKEQDLASRLISIEMQPFEEQEGKTKKAERQLWKEYNEVKGSIFAGLLELASLVQRDADKHQNKPIRHRMADLVIVGRCIEHSLGYASGTFEKAYDRSIRVLEANAIDANTFLSALVEMMHDKRTFTGTASELLDAIKGYSSSDAANMKYFPAANRIKPTMRRNYQLLKNEGIYYEYLPRTGNSRGHYLSYEPPEDATQAPIKEDKEEL